MTDLPGEAAPRLRTGSFSSTLSTADLSSTLAAGLEPVGLVQGTCVMRWSWFGPRSPYGGSLPIGSGTTKLKRRYFEPRTGAFARRSAGSARSIVYEANNYSTWACEHEVGTAGKHEPGVNFEQSWVETLWDEGFTKARARLVEEARLTRAHGVVGVVESVTAPARDTQEFSLSGTAVRVKDAPEPLETWSTFLAGERLIKLVEAGWAPVAVTSALGSIRVWPSCTTESQRSGRWSQVSPIRQLESAQYSARLVAQRRLHGEAGSDDVHGVRYQVAERRIARGDDEVTCTIFGSRIRRFGAPERLAPAKPTLRLG